MNERVFDVHCIEITFQLPEWFPQDRFDYQNYNSISCDRHYGNRAEDLFFKRFPDCKVIQRNAWVTFEFKGACSGDHLNHWIRYIKHKLHKFFKQYKEWTPEWEARWVNTISKR